MEEKINETTTEEVCACEHSGHHHDHDHGHEEHDHHHEHHHDHEEHDHHHDHHHDHEEHDHHHDHHHDHEEYDHHHDHHHDHHDHEHHHHDHGHQHEVPGFRIFETHSHEGATVCSFEKDIMGSPEIVVKQMEECIQTLEQWLDANDAAIGHVKGYVKEPGPITTFSTVGCGLNIEKHEGKALAIGFAAIVFGPTEDELKDKVIEIFSAVGK